MAEIMKSEENESLVDRAVAEGGAYELIRDRLLAQGKALQVETQSLNNARIEEFGSTDMFVVGRARARTENNCTARDIIRVGDYLLFGYNVFIGLKKETKIEDVFALYKLQQNDGSFDFSPQSISGTFLSTPQFVKEFNELYAYYKNSRLLQLVVKNQKLLAAFQIGEKVSDIKVFRWNLSSDEKEITYIDNRGERDIALPSNYDFEWQEVTRDFSVHGRHPHFNIHDKVFVETVGGSLTIKIEDNTEDGLGIYSEDVEDKTQSLDDANIYFAPVGNLILLKIKPYREEKYRYLVFNCDTKQVDRIDEIGESCVQLPENHGIIFPGGIYLKNGESKKYESETNGLRFKRRIRSPNGEDVLFVFYEPEGGVVALFAYNLINKQLQNPIYCHGYTIFDDGRAVMFSTEDSEPTRVHPMQIWQTPYESEEFASKAPANQNFYGKVGNAELVRGISDLFSICKGIVVQKPTAALYVELQNATRKIYDDYHWIDSCETAEINSVLKEVIDTADLILEEFEKVESIRKNSIESLRDAELSQKKILDKIRPERWEEPQQYVDALNEIKQQRGKLLSLKELRYVDLSKIDILESDVLKAQENLSAETLSFLQKKEALEPYQTKISEMQNGLDTAKTLIDISPIIESVDKVAIGLDLLSEIVASLKVNDANVRTSIIDAISDIYAKLNQLRSKAKNKAKNVGRDEAVAQFSAQFKLFTQSIANALSVCDTPTKCDEQLSRLLMQLEDLESQFSRFDEFLADIVAKREEVYESFENHKQKILDERQRKAQSVADAADRIVANIDRRIKRIKSADELNTYFSSDALVLKVKEFVEQLYNLDSVVKADDINAQIKGAKEQAIRLIRDKQDIYEDGGNVIKLGPRHKFNVNTQELDLTIISKNDDLFFHLTGTDFFEVVSNGKLDNLKQYWSQNLISENQETYRAEYLAFRFFQSCTTSIDSLSPEKLSECLGDEQIFTKTMREYASPRYKEGYEKGVHDHDAIKILQALAPVIRSCDLLRYSPQVRGMATVFWANTQKSSLQQSWPSRARSALQLESEYGSRKALEFLVSEVSEAITGFYGENRLNTSSSEVSFSAEYLVHELGRERIEFITSKYAVELADALKREMNTSGTWRGFESALKELTGRAGDRWYLTQAWLQALCDNGDFANSVHFIPEAISLLNCDERIGRRQTEADLNVVIGGLIGQHPKILNQTIEVSVDEFLIRLDDHVNRVIPEYENFLLIRQSVIDEMRDTLRLEEFKPRPLSSFVRNKLINEAYLPIIGDNLAKQMGTVGEKKRSDLMGLLMMISPPGYGKTTLMEYVASRLGLIFMKINCPSMGHEVDSLDPEQAPNATARQELEKLNLGLEMGSNVMLYLDDIQHTNPEFLQKFISLCDGTRRIEGVWRGRTKTYDMRGRKFCVVMAGNPYTESGELFKIPDMLANRADIYNLGDVLGGQEDVFALSYLENSLTSNAVLAPLATRDLNDFYKFVEKANGLQVANTDLSYGYSGAEVNEITSVLQKLFKVRDVILKVNQQYIASAAQGDQYREEPAFKLQGSYRNMNKMAEKISAVMNDKELQRVINDHYSGEAQLLTTGAEENLLKLKELRGVLKEQEQKRWQTIKAEFKKQRLMGGGDADSGTKVANQLAELVLHAENISETVSKPREESGDNLMSSRLMEINKTLQSYHGQGAQLESLLSSLEDLSRTLAGVRYNVEVVNEPVPGIDVLLQTIASTLESSIFPLVRSMEGKLNIDLRTHERLGDIFDRLKNIESLAQTTTVSVNPIANESPDGK